MTSQELWEQRAHQKNIVSKLQMKETAGQAPCFPLQIECKIKMVGGETNRLKRFKRHFNQLQQRTLYGFKR